MSFANSGNFDKTRSQFPQNVIFFMYLFCERPIVNDPEPLERNRPELSKSSRRSASFGVIGLEVVEPEGRRQDDQTSSMEVSSGEGGETMFSQNSETCDLSSVV